MKEIISHSIKETEKTAKDWLDSLSKVDDPTIMGEGATVVTLNGHLGSGKTTFTQSVARALGIAENITSPTFVIMKIYDIPKGVGLSQLADKFKRLVHIDAYRLERGEELGALDFESVVADPGNLVLIEWAENVKDGLPDEVKKIDFEYVGENERKICFN